ncbi:MAG: manganese efflux pump [Clostridia bacterium]|nr:manganese efflux pump [Clostridia bacterium]
MNPEFMFFFNSVLLGIGLAMDAFSISMANGLNEPNMHKRKLILIAGIFAFFQALMPIIGWLCVHTIVCYFKNLADVVPYVALVLLCFIGGKMLKDGLDDSKSEQEPVKLGFVSLLVQGVATSIDALSVGFTIADYDISSALLCAFIISVVTFIICTFGLLIGKKLGEKLKNKSQLLGGAILIFIGLEIFITNVF